MQSLHVTGQARKPSDVPDPARFAPPHANPVGGGVNRGALQVDEIADAEHGAQHLSEQAGPLPDASLGALLVYALGGGEVGAARALVRLAASLATAAQCVNGGLLDRDAVDAAERLTTVADEVMRRERIGIALERAEAVKAGEREARRLEVLGARLIHLGDLVDDGEAGAPEEAEIRAISTELCGVRDGAEHLLERAEHSLDAFLGAQAFKARMMGGVSQ
jgi:hypothetical protein